MSPACPSAEQLRRLLRDGLPGPEAAPVEAHVETCVACQRALEELTAASPNRSNTVVPSGVLRRLEAQPPTLDLPARALAPARTAEAEVRDLLHSRLRLLAGMGFALTALYAVLYLSFAPADPLMLLVYGLVLVVSGGLSVLLWARRPRATNWLRWGELALLGSMVAFSTRLQFLVYDWWPVSFPPGDWNGPLKWPAASMYARSLDFNWVLFVVTYGLIIPNTWRRAAVVVLALAGWAVLLNAVLGLPGGSGWDRTAVTLASSINLALAAGLALFGARRFEALREQAARHRRLGQYRLKSKLGAGGMGEVWLAEHVLLRRPCAVKLIRPERLGDPRAQRRFEREVQATATLSHPNTVEIYDYGPAEDGTFYYAMEYLPGQSLQELVTAGGPLPPARAVHLLRQVCGALGEAHAAGLVHRDVKPGNVLVCERGGLRDVAKLLDFGLVRAHGIGHGAETLTEVGTIAGTPAYMSPEQARGDDADARSDLYSVGAMAYFLMTGEPPFVRASPVETLAAHLAEPVVPPRRHRELPADLEAVVLRCLEKEPARRFQTAEGLEQALAHCACAGGHYKERS